MNKPLDIKALDVFLSAVEDRLVHLESKMGMYKDEDEEREPVSEDTLEKKASCPDCGMAEGECKCGYFDIDRKTYVVDAETKVRYVRDAAYWGVPVMTPIVPGMKPQGPTSPAGRARRSSMTGRGIRRSMPRTSSGGDKTPGRAAPRKRVKPKTGATSDRPITRQGKDPIPRIGSRSGDGGKKPPSKPTPSSSGGDKPESRYTHNDIASAQRALRDAEFDTANEFGEDILDAGARNDLVKDIAMDSSPEVRRDLLAGELGFSDAEIAKFNRDNGLSDDKQPTRKPGAKKPTRPEYAKPTYRTPGGDKPKKPMRRVRKGKDSAENPDGTPIHSDVDTSVRKAEDFSVKSAAEELKKIPAKGRPDATGELDDPIDCGSDIEKAQRLLGEGKHIRLNTPLEASMLMDKLAEEAEAAKKAGKGTPDYDLCRVSVPGKNLFCQGNKGIERVHMPQFSGEPVEGSYAETKFNPDKGESNVEAEFAELLQEMGIGVEEKTVKAQDLKATQSQLVGTKVSGMRKAMREGKIKDAPIYVTRDGYIVDGHHRWAAKMGLDIEDGVLGDVDMPVRMIDAEIGQILDISNGFTEMAGIKAKATGAAADGVGKKPTTGRSGDSVVLDGVGTVVQSDNTQGKKWWNILDEFSKKSDDDCGCSGNA